MTAFFGGRAECRVRQTPVPVGYLDFLSMYPTVNTLMGLWSLLTAQDLHVVDATDDVRDLLASVTLDACFRPELWGQLPILVQIVPDGDILLVRAKYGSSNAWQIALNWFETTEPLWYTLADCIASTLLTGKPPRVVQALRLEPSEDRQSGLTLVALRGTLQIDPVTDDFFRRVIELRKSLPPDMPKQERERLNQFLKVLANSTSYGIFAEMNRQDLGRGERATVTVHGIDAEPFSCRVSGPEEPGDWCFPPLAAFIAGAARLMLAMLECCATDLGGTYAFCDTDSMAIVANEHGGLIYCPGGPLRHDGQPAIRALSWEQVRQIQDRFNALHPYDRAIVRDDLLELEKFNFTKTGDQRQLFCLAISAKRYVLYALDEQGEPELVKWSEHGLGHLLNPTGPDLNDRDWMRQLWEGIVRETLGLPYTWPTWLDRPALSRLTISSPELLRPFHELNAGKAYPDQIKPFNFLLAAHVKPFGYPDDVNAEHFQLFAPYESDPCKWDRLPWLDRYSGTPFHITTVGPTGGPGFARVQTYRDVLEEFRHHPEAKSADANGRPCRRQTRGLLRRRRVRAHPDLLTYVGKESNKLEEVDAGIEHDPDEVYSQFADPRREPWFSVILPVLRELSCRLMASEAGISTRAIGKLLRESSQPRNATRKTLTRLAGSYAREKLTAAMVVVPIDDVVACAAYLRMRGESGGLSGAPAPLPAM
jgi:hypothetical protein